jgi:type IV pilus assembly protein PilN
MRFTINLATRTYLNHRLLNTIGFCVIVALVAISAWNINRLASNYGEQSRIRTEIVAIESKLGVKPAGVPEAAVSLQKAHIRFYNEIIARKSKNWLNILEFFENDTPDGISLSLLSPEKKSDEWKLEGRARSFKSVQQYLEKLEASKNFSNVLLLSNQNIAAGEMERGVQFSISCKVINR